MKNIAIFSLLILISSCKETSKTDEPTANKEEITFKMNTLIDDPEEEGRKMLLGKINKEGLASKDFTWFIETMKLYDANDTIIDALQKPLKDFKIKVFMGTWCEDSQREVPALYAILNEANYNISTMELIAVSHDKDTPQAYEKDLNIEYVPTIILYKEGKELGRIVESTHGSLEEDLLTIASGEEYRHMYEE